MSTELQKIKKQIELLRQQEEELTTKEKASVIEQMNQQIADYNIRSRDLKFAGSKYQPSKNKVAVKYKKGVNAWSGRGRQPKWVVDHISKGGKIEDLLVK